MWRTNLSQMKTLSKPAFLFVALPILIGVSVVRAQNDPQAAIAKKQAELERQRIELEKKSLELQQKELDLEKARQEFETLFLQFDPLTLQLRLLFRNRRLRIVLRPNNGNADQDRQCNGKEGGFR